MITSCNLKVEYAIVKREKIVVEQRKGHIPPFEKSCSLYIDF